MNEEEHFNKLVTNYSKDTELTTEDIERLKKAYMRSAEKGSLKDDDHRRAIFSLYTEQLRERNATKKEPNQARQIASTEQQQPSPSNNNDQLLEQTNKSLGVVRGAVNKAIQPFGNVGNIEYNDATWADRGKEVLHGMAEGFDGVANTALKTPNYFLEKTGKLTGNKLTEEFGKWGQAMADTNPLSRSIKEALPTTNTPDTISNVAHAVGHSIGEIPEVIALNMALGAALTNVAGGGLVGAAGIIVAKGIPKNLEVGQKIIQAAKKIRDNKFAKGVVRFGKTLKNTGTAGENLAAATGYGVATGYFDANNKDIDQLTPYGVLAQTLGGIAGSVAGVAAFTKSKSLGGSIAISALDSVNNTAAKVTDFTSWGEAWRSILHDPKKINLGAKKVIDEIDKEVITNDQIPEILSHLSTLPQSKQYLQTTLGLLSTEERGLFLKFAKYTAYDQLSSMINNAKEGVHQYLQYNIFKNIDNSKYIKDYAPTLKTGEHGFDQVTHGVLKDKIEPVISELQPSSYNILEAQKNVLNSKLNVNEGINRKHLINLFDEVEKELGYDTLSQATQQRLLNFKDKYIIPQQGGETIVNTLSNKKVTQKDIISFEKKEKLPERGLVDKKDVKNIINTRDVLQELSNARILPHNSQYSDNLEKAAIKLVEKAKKSNDVKYQDFLKDELNNVVNNIPLTEIDTLIKSLNKETVGDSTVYQRLSKKIRDSASSKNTSINSENQKMFSELKKGYLEESEMLNLTNAILNPDKVSFADNRIFSKMNTQQGIEEVGTILDNVDNYFSKVTKQTNVNTPHILEQHAPRLKEFKDQLTGDNKTFKQFVYEIKAQQILYNGMYKDNAFNPKTFLKTLNDEGALLSTLIGQEKLQKITQNSQILAEQLMRVEERLGKQAELFANNKTAKFLLGSPTILTTATLAKMYGIKAAAAGGGAMLSASKVAASMLTNPKHVDILISAANRSPEKTLNLLEKVAMIYMSRYYTAGLIKSGYNRATSDNKNTYNTNFFKDENE